MMSHVNVFGTQKDKGDKKIILITVKIAVGQETSSILIYLHEYNIGEFINNSIFLRSTFKSTKK